MTQHANVERGWPRDRSGDERESNLQIYDAADVAAHYAALEYVSPCEKLLFDAFLKPGGALLDLGVGGGRTTAYLAGLASRYVGVDYAPKMVAACQHKFPRLEFRVADATDLSLFDDQSFDAVVMAFNGIDYVIPDEARCRCLREIRRVLKNEGVLIFSSHNPRAVFFRPAWNRKKIEDFARSLAGTKEWLYGPSERILLWLRVVVAVGRASASSLLRLSSRGFRRAFWLGEGYMVDPAHGGLTTHYAVPARVIAELEGKGFRFLRMCGDDYPRQSGTYVTDWYYYVFHRAETAVDSPCA
jgi:SAM-dependent methyltransferase